LESSLQSFSQATIRLTLNNSGIQAFRNDVYGPNIIIERVIHSNGSSSYKFRGSLDGKIVATKREELTHIVEHFDITIDSPLAVLTQDAARSFLQNASESSLYSVGAAIFYVFNSLIISSLFTVQVSNICHYNTRG